MRDLEALRATMTSFLHFCQLEKRLDELVRLAKENSRRNADPNAPGKSGVKENPNQPNVLHRKHSDRATITANAATMPMAVMRPDDCR